MMSTRFRVLPLVVLCGLVWLAPTLTAVGIRPLSIATLARQADVVLHGKVLSKTCQQDPAGRIYTRIELEVFDVWKGAISGSPFHLVQGGGVVGERRSIVPAQAEYGLEEEVVVFLVRNQRGEALTVGLSQGKFHVQTDAKSGAKSAFNPFHGAPAAATTAFISQPNGLGPEPRPLSLETLRKQVLDVRE